MPKVLEDCVRKVMWEGHSRDEAYGICAKRTGWVKRKGGGWRNKETGKTYKEK